LLAELGYEKLDDIIGRTEILKARNIQLAKTQLLDLSYLMAVCTCEQISHRILKDFQVFAYFSGDLFMFQLQLCWLQLVCVKSGPSCLSPTSVAQVGNRKCFGTQWFSLLL
jgi:hypothetical protein